MAKVTKSFKGVPDGETQTLTFVEGDEVIGDLAIVAIREGWAEEDKKSPPKTAKKKTDKAFADMTGEELTLRAAEMGVDISAAGSAAEVIAALEAATAANK